MGTRHRPSAALVGLLLALVACGVVGPAYAQTSTVLVRLQSGITVDSSGGFTGSSSTKYEAITNGFVYMSNTTRTTNIVYSFPIMNFDLTTIPSYTNKVCVSSLALRWFPNNDCCMIRGLAGFYYSGSCCSGSPYNAVNPACSVFTNSNPFTSGIASLNFFRINSNWNGFTTATATWNAVHATACGGSSPTRPCFAVLDVYSYAGTFSQDTSARVTYPYFSGWYVSGTPDCSSNNAIANNAFTALIAARFANDAIAGSGTTAGQLSFFLKAYMNANSGYYGSWITRGSPDKEGTGKADVNLVVTYSTCVSTANCVSDTGACTCTQAYYLGDGRVGGTGCQAPVSCPSFTYNGYTFPAAAAGATATATSGCPTGYTGSITMTCDNYGSGSLAPYRTTNGFNTNTYSFACNPNVCTADSSGAVGNAVWSQTTFSSTPVQASGCISGASPNGALPFRLCQAAGWAGSLSSGNPCMLAQCLATTFGGVTFSNTAAGAVGSAACPSGFTGTATMSCTGGTSGWNTASFSTASCAASACSPLTGNSATGAATYQSTASSGMATGVCPANWAGSPTRICGASGDVWGAESNPCTRVVCSAITGDPATGTTTYLQTNSGATGAGTCPTGWTGSPQRPCTSSSTVLGTIGSWGTETNSCTRIQCPLLTNDATTSASWPATNTGSIAPGTCSVGYNGSPTRVCNNPASGGVGDWSATINNPCVIQTCASTSDATSLATYQQTNAFVTVVGSCNTGYAGAPTRACNGGVGAASWATSYGGTACTAITCPVLSNDNNADWPVTSLAGVSSKTVQGTCRTGYSSVATQPQRTCAVSGSTGAWGATITYPCLQNTCAQLANDGNAVWNATLVNVNSPFTITVTGTCRPGYTGTVSRVCSIDGTWGVISGTCNQIFCQPFYSSGDRATYPTISAGTNNVPGQCDATYAGVPRRNCKIDGTWDTTSAVGGTACTPATCPPLANDYDASWPQGTVNQAASGTCLPGFYTGAPQRLCNADGSWSSTITGTPCTAVVCNINDQSGNAVWPATVQTGTTATATGCATGFYSSGQLPTRACLADGVLGTVSGGCLQTYCAALYLDNNANWTQAVAGSTSAPGTCIAGWTGAPTRSCSTSGIWGATVNNPCIQRTCAAQIDTVNRASFPDGTPAGDPTPVSGMCNAGWAGSPTKLCPIAGVFGNTLYSGSCTQLFCQALTDDFNAAWEATAAGLSAGGTCLAGFGGTTSRTCSITGVWEDPTDMCQPLNCTGFSTADGGTVFSIAEAGSSAVGSCAPGWTFSSDGPPSISCPRTTGSAFFDQASLVNPCVRITCGAYTTDDVSFSATNAGTTALGDCQAGYTVTGGGRPQRVCNIDGTWGTVAASCSLLYCPTSSLSNAFWNNTTPAGFVGSGLCATGFQPNGDPPTRQCLITGAWDDTVTNPCIPLYCPAETTPETSWPQTQALGQQITSICAVTYNGSPKRVCQTSGQWGPVITPCDPVYCAAPQAPVQNAVFSQARANSTVTGVCLDGFVGSPKRMCSINAVWQVVENPCVPDVPPCASELFQNAVWPISMPDSFASGQCDGGYEGNPTRFCDSTGLWSQAVSSPCTPITPVSDGVVSNLRVPAYTSTSVTLAWTANITGNATYIVQLSDDDNFFQTIFTSQPIRNPNVTVTGLFEYTLYYFRVATQTSTTTSISKRTAIANPGGIAVSNLSPTGVTLRWSAAGAKLAQWYLVWVTGVGAAASRRSVHGERVLLANLTVGADGAGSYTAQNLTSSSEYNFWVQAGREGAPEPVGTNVFVTTLAEVDNSSGADSRYVAIGASLGVLFFLLLVALAIFFIYRRRKTKEKERKLLELRGAESDSTFGLISMHHSRGLIPDQVMIGKSSDAGSIQARTQLIAGDQTLLNTIMEVALPGFLQLNYETDVRPETKLTAGGAGTIFRATLLDNKLASRHQTRVVALKQVADWPNLSEEDNEQRFHQEVSIMWSLSFHPNIIKMIGYTDSPRTIVTRLYPTDMFRYLHLQDDKSQLESGLMLHFTSGMMAGLAAIHSMGIAHRDVKSPNILLAEPTTTPYPDPVVCDFGLSRTADDTVKKYSVINGFSPRYAPPEVFARVHLKNMTNTVEDDKMSDVYSMGVVFWETFDRKVPWKDTANEEIEMIIRRGGRVPPVYPNEKDDVHVIVCAIIDQCLQQLPERRPTAAAINSKLLDVVRSHTSI